MDANEVARLQKIKGIGPKRSEAILLKLGEMGKSLDDLFTLSSSEINQQFKLPINVAEAIVEAKPIEKTEPVTSQNDPLSVKGIRILKRGTSDYPQRLSELLGDKAPEVLYVWGNTALFDKPAVGFCGSREASEKNIEVAAKTAEEVAHQDWVVVSGHARGVDTAAHRAALEHGSGTIIVAAEGLLSFKLRQELKRIAKPEQILIVSQFPPDAKWTVGRAMARNSIIIGLSDAMVLVAARTEGGTFEAGKAALRLKIPLYVARYSSPGDSAAGNTYFLDRGAIPLNGKQETGRPNVDNLIQTVNTKRQPKPESSSTPPQPEQMALLL